MKKSKTTDTENIGEQIMKHAMAKNFIDAFNKEIHMFVAQMTYTARLHRIKYLALIKEGFDKSQALELCKDTSFGQVKKD